MLAASSAGTGGIEKDGELGRQYRHYPPSWPVCVGRISVVVRVPANGSQHFLPVLRATGIARPMAAAPEQPAARELRAKRFGRSARAQIAVAIGETNDPVGVRDIEILRVRAGRVKGDSERLV